MTARAAERVLQEAIKAFEAHLLDARNRERFGMAARNEVLAVEVERDRTELDRLQATASADVAEANLRRLLDLPPATRVEPTEALEAPPVGASELEPLVSEAAAGRADRKALLARVSATEALVGVERGGRLPQVALTAGYTYANPNRDIVPPTTTWKDTWDVGASFAWSVFDGGRRSASEARARAQADAARQQLRELDRAIRLEVTQRLLELRTAAQRRERRGPRPRGRPREPQGGAGPLPRGRHPLLRAARRRDRARAGGACSAPRPWPRCASPPPGLDRAVGR